MYNKNNIYITKNLKANSFLTLQLFAEFERRKGKFGINLDCYIIDTLILL